MLRRVLLLTFLLAGCASFQPGGHFKSLGPYSNPYQSNQNYYQDTENYQKYRPQGPLHLKWPVKRIKLTQRFRPRRNRKHEGIDLAGRYNSPILAAHEGYVVYTGSQYRGYGRMVIIEYNQTWATLYGHLEKIYVKQGQVVQAGETIASMGNTGRSSGVHLHFELLKNKLPIDPLPYLKSSSRIVSR